MGGIILNKYLEHIKNLGVFSLGEIFIIFICSILNLILKSSNVTTIILFVVNILLFGFFGYKYGLKTNKKGLIIGLYVGISLILFLMLLNAIFYQQGININRILYYGILVLSSMFGASFGKNKQVTK